MNLLIICYSYPPHNSPRAFRWSSIAEQWAAQGYHVDVISAWHPGYRYNEILNGVNIYRVGRSLVETIKRLFSKPTPHNGVDQQNSSLSNDIVAKSTVAGIAKWIYDRSWKKVYWPDYACLWYYPALKMARALAGVRRYDGLVTASLPFTAHAVGYTLIKSLNMPWVVDVGDPFCYMKDTPVNNHRLYDSLNHSFEKKVFDLATSVSVTTEPTKKIYEELFLGSAGKIYVIPPLLSVKDSVVDKVNATGTRHKMKFTFFGTLHRTIRNADFLLQVFTKLLDSELTEKIELHFYGRIQECQDSFSPYANLMDKKLFLHGVVPRDKAIEAMKESDVLINIGNDTIYQLPSKVVEYASTGKPILNLVKNSGDSSVAFFREYPACLNLYTENQVEPNSEQLSQLISFIETPPVIDPVKLNKWLNLYRTEAVAMAYEKLLRM